MMCILNKILKIQKCKGYIYSLKIKNDYYFYLKIIVIVL